LARCPSSESDPLTDCSAAVVTTTSYPLCSATCYHEKCQRKSVKSKLITIGANALSFYLFCISCSIFSSKQKHSQEFLSLPTVLPLSLGWAQAAGMAKLPTIFRNQQLSKSLESITKPMGTLILREKKNKKALLLNPQQYLKSRHQPRPACSLRPK